MENTPAPSPYRVNIHNKPVKTTLKETTLDSIRKYNARFLLSATLIPGKKIFERCEMKLNPSTDEFDDDQGEYSHDDSMIHLFLNVA